MKKCLRFILLLALFTVLLCITALAAEPTAPGIYGVTAGTGATVVVQDAGGTAISPAAVEIGALAVSDYYADAVRLQVTLSGAADGYWLVLAQSDTGVPTDSNIKYIDQQSASGGTVTFNVYPSELTKGTYYIYLVSSAGRGDPLVTFNYHQPFKMGDVDRNDAVNANDALWVLQRSVGNRVFDAIQESIADVDKNKAINANDALWILQASVGNRDKETWQLES